MRVVEEAAGLEAAIAWRPAGGGAAFGDDTLFLEKWLARARHVEMQILGDLHGNLVHCFERECSIQRRHQKVIEEAPSPAVTPQLRSALGTQPSPPLASSATLRRHVEFFAAGRRLLLS